MLSIDEAKALIRGGLGEAELNFISSLCAPLFWLLRGPNGAVQVRNGTAFFLDVGGGPFAITAHHVLAGWRQDLDTPGTSSCHLGAVEHPLRLDFGGANQIIAEHSGIDIVTFKITPKQIASIGRTILTGYQKRWPPSPPQVDRGIYYAGFPGTGTQFVASNAISFGIVPGSGIASSISDKDVSTLIEREHLMGILGKGVPPENFDFRGISGGPMLTIVEANGLRSWMLAGVIYEGPNTAEDEAQAIAGLEIIRARRAHFLLPDGQLDVSRWDTLA